MNNLAVKAMIAPALKQEAESQLVTALSLGHRLETAKENVEESKKTVQGMRALNQYAPTEFLKAGRLAL
ncbi:hypothetical protein H6F76_18085 [Leptolyngbya sp. FACHB-321]|uniref:hypothetical protein n=1 Tax=Leptolyngbya sp. FACHB-321 TaxID=2692807 RepID=UPI0016894791|nr:hypothetical protein [Leptolyngbya sp. FACHB-321]MBD2036920.1 hypothetical protein [Leptolyngbya sp. FACHB-321]